MPRFEDRRVIPFSRSLLYEIARDVARYPDFLPWCVGARVYAEQAKEDGSGRFDADLIVGFRLFRERFTSRVTYRRDEAVEATYIKGPMKYCFTRWHFRDTPKGAAAEGPEGAAAETTEVCFFVDFAFDNRLLQATVEEMFLRAVTRMTQAFRDRAAFLSGAVATAKPHRAGSSPFLQMLHERQRGQDR